MVADEPISALDVSVAAAVIELLLQIQRAERTALLLISHDLGTVRYLADHVVVMYLGQIMESGTADSVLQPPYLPDTEVLLAAVPVADPQVVKRGIMLEGSPPSALDLPVECPFASRCPRKLGAICDTDRPPARQGARALARLPHPAARAPRRRAGIPRRRSRGGCAIVASQRRLADDPWSSGSPS